MSLSERLLYNANSAIYQLNQDGNKLTFNEMMMTMCALYQTNTLSWILIQLAHWNNSPRIDMSPRPTRTHYPDSEPASLGSFYLMLCAQHRRNNYQLQIVSNQRSTAFKTSTLTITQPGWLHLQNNGHIWTIFLRN